MVGCSKQMHTHAGGIHHQVVERPHWAPPGEGGRTGPTTSPTPMRVTEWGARIHLEDCGKVAGVLFCNPTLGRRPCIIPSPKAGLSRPGVKGGWVGRWVFGYTFNGMASETPYQIAEWLREGAKDWQPEMSTGPTQQPQLGEHPPSASTQR